MGKISSYGVVSDPQLGDKLIGTKIGGSPINGTYNFTIQQLADLISGQITLQEVLDAGNTATKNINLTGIINATTLNVGNITSTGIVTSANAVVNGYLKDKNNSAGTSGQLLSSTVTGTQWIDAPSGSVNIYNANGTLTGNRVVTMGSYYLSFDKDLTINGLTVGKGLGNVLTNTAVGNFALSNNTIGAYNTSVGYGALLFNTEGSANTAIGYESLKDNTTGSGSISLGYQALQNNTTGYNNIGFGSTVLNANTIGYDNVAIGESAGYSNISGYQNVFIGSQSDALGTNNINSIVIGYGAIGAGNNTVVLGHTSIVKTILRGTVNMANLPTSAAGLVSGDLWKNGTTVSIV